MQRDVLGAIVCERDLTGCCGAGGGDYVEAGGVKAEAGVVEHRRPAAVDSHASRARGQGDQVRRGGVDRSVRNQGSDQGSSAGVHLGPSQRSGAGQGVGGVHAPVDLVAGHSGLGGSPAHVAEAAEDPDAWIRVCTLERQRNHVWRAVVSERSADAGRHLASGRSTEDQQAVSYGRNWGGRHVNMQGGAGGGLQPEDPAACGH